MIVSARISTSSHCSGPDSSNLQNGLGQNLKNSCLRSKMQIDFFFNTVMLTDLMVTVYSSSLTSPGLCLEDRARVLRFLMTTLPGDLTPSLNKQLILWLSYSRSPQTTSGLFRSADVTELDGSSAVGICTAFTLGNLLNYKTI